jgi:hypothetical protein
MRHARLRHGIAVLAGLAACGGQALAAQQAPIETFVSRLYFEGVPYEEAIRYPATDVPKLLGMLRDRANAPYWANIAGVIGMIGDAAAADSLAAYAEGGTGATLSPEEYRARTTAVLALGYIVNRTGDRRVLQRLVDDADPARWAGRGVRWRSPVHRDDAGRNLELSKMAVLGLALAGNAESGAALRALRGAGAPAGVANPDLQAVVAMAIGEHDVIGRDGLVRYYRDRRRGH